MKTSFSVGQKINKWTILNDKTEKKNKEIYWYCRCDCGKEKFVMGRLLRTNKSKSCRSCSVRKTQEKKGIKLKKGEKFGFWEIVKKDTEKSIQKSMSHYYCKCKCGIIKSILANSLIRNKSSGCIKCRSTSQFGKNNFHFTGYEEIYGSYWNSIRDGAIKRNLEFNITLEEIWDLFLKQNRKCALSGVGIEFKPKSGVQTASLDRIDSNFGYTISNVQWVHKDINFMKQSMKDTDFINWCGIIWNFNNGKITNK